LRKKGSGDFLELSIIWNTAFAAGFLKIILSFYNCQNAPFRGSFLGSITYELNRNKVNIRWKWDLKRFTLPISTLDTKVVSTTRYYENGATGS
jgi:hypothetical protein